jgi:tryptophan-rich sensory protein
VIAALSERGLEIMVALALVAVCAVAGGLLTEIGPWYESLRFPRLRPPNWVFGPAWTVIFLLIAASGVIAWEAASGSAQRILLITLFIINGALNVLWSPLFFKLRRPDWAFYELIPFWLSIVVLVVTLFQISTLAGALILPYLAWVTFAGWLNLRIVQLNSPFQPRILGAWNKSPRSKSDGRISS